MAGVAAGHTQPTRLQQLLAVPLMCANEANSQLTPGGENHLRAVHQLAFLDCDPVTYHDSLYALLACTVGLVAFSSCTTLTERL